MKLAFKFIGVFLVGIMIVWTGNSILRVRREIATFRAEMIQNQQFIGHAYRNFMVYVWKTGGQEAALREMESASRRYRTVRWVWLDEPAEAPFLPKVDRAKLAQVLAGKDAAFEERGPDGRGFLITYSPAPVVAGRQGAVEVARSQKRMDQYIQYTIQRILIVNTIMFLLSALIAVLSGVWFVARPLRRLIEKTRRVGEGDLTGPVTLRGHDELTDLATALNAMCDQLRESHARVQAEINARAEAMNLLRHGERLQTVGRLASGVAHELGTPLNVVSGRANLVLSGALTPEQIRENCDVIRDQAKRMTAIIQQLLDFARRRVPHKTSTDLRDVVRQATELMKSYAQKHQVTIAPSALETEVRACVDMGQILQVLTNLILNAVQAMPAGGTIEIDIGRESARAPEDENAPPVPCVRLDVRDNGAGIAETDLPRVFEPFFTTKAVGEGTGLGLSVAYGIVREHGGWITAASAPQQGSRFSVYLPVEEKAP